jgi:hypothetical protein
MADSEPEHDLLSELHFARFGSIIHSFARLEYMIQVAMAVLADIPPPKIVVMTKALSYSQKRDTFLSLHTLKLFEVTKLAHQTELKELFDRAHTYNALRNNIAHAIWRQGTRPGSIRAGYVDVRGGKGKIAGLDDDEKDYTLDELGAIANDLRKIDSDVLRCLNNAGWDTDPEEPSSQYDNLPEIS